MKNNEKVLKKKSNGFIKVVFVLFLILILVLVFVLKNPIIYSLADKDYKNTNYTEAIKKFEYLEHSNYKNSKEMITECEYQIAIRDINNNPIKSLQAFEKLGDYKDSKKNINKAKKNILDKAKKSIENKEFDKAQNYIDAIPKYKGVKNVQKELYYQQAKKYDADGDWVKAKKLYKKVKGYKKTDEILKTVKYGIIGNRYIWGFYSYDVYSGRNAVIDIYQFENTVTNISLIGNSDWKTYELFYEVEGTTIKIMDDNTGLVSKKVSNIKWKGDNIVEFTDNKGDKYQYVDKDATSQDLMKLIEVY